MVKRKKAAPDKTGLKEEKAQMQHGIKVKLKSSFLDLGDFRSQ